MKAHLATEYLKYIIFRPHHLGHGIHSPYLFNMLTQVMYSDTKESKLEVEKIDSLRQSLLKNKQYIHVTDLGAGSTKINSGFRRIGHIAKYCSSTPHDGRLLHRLSNYAKPETILELGTCLGLGTLYLHSGNPIARTYTLEGSPSLNQLSKIHFHHLGYNQIHSMVGDFYELLPEVLLLEKTFDLIYLDGNHTGEATLHYFDKILPYTNQKTIIIMDDIRWSSDMYSAWKKITAIPQIRVSLDLFHLGILIFNQELQKEHFVIYY